MAGNRGNVWTKQETMALLDIWRDEDIEGQLQNVRRNIPIYARLSELLQIRGYDRTAEQCRTKLKGLKHDYVKSKRNLSKSGTSGGRSLLTEEEFDILDQVLCARPLHNPGAVVDTLADDALGLHGLALVQVDDAGGLSDCEESDQDQACQGDDDPFMSDAASDGQTLDDRREYPRTGSTSSSLSTSSTSSNRSAEKAKAKVHSKVGGGKSDIKEPKESSCKRLVNDFSKPTPKKQKKDQFAGILDDFFRHQDESRIEFRQHEEEIFQRHLAAERELRQQEFQQNMAMMKEMMGFMFMPNSVANTAQQAAATRPVASYPPPVVSHPDIGPGPIRRYSMPHSNSMSQSMPFTPQPVPCTPQQGSSTNQRQDQHKNIFSVLSSSFDLLNDEN